MHLVTSVSGVTLWNISGLVSKYPDDDGRALAGARTFIKIRGSFGTTWIRPNSSQTGRISTSRSRARRKTRNRECVVWLMLLKRGLITMSSSHPCPRPRKQNRSYSFWSVHFWVQKFAQRNSYTLPELGQFDVAGGVLASAAKVKSSHRTSWKTTRWVHYS